MQLAKEQTRWDGVQDTWQCYLSPSANGTCDTFTRPAVRRGGCCGCHQLCLLSFPLCHRLCVLSGKNLLKSFPRYCRLNKGTKSILLEGLGSEMEHNHLTIILGIMVIFSHCVLLCTASYMEYDTRKSCLSSVVIYLT